MLQFPFNMLLVRHLNRCTVRCNSNSNSNSNPKPCIQCKHVIMPNPDSSEFRCRLSFQSIDYVTGKVSYDYAYKLRNKEGICGPEGNLFQTQNQLFLSGVLLLITLCFLLIKIELFL